jgi:hypothetical protein
MQWVQLLWYRKSKVVAEKSSISGVFGFFGGRRSSNSTEATCNATLPKKLQLLRVSALSHYQSAPFKPF